MIGTVPSFPRPSRSFLVWFFIATAAAAILQYSRTQAVGGDPAGLLYAGTWQEVHVVVAEELPRAPVVDGWGHDGQIFYAMGLDLRGDHVPDVLLNAPYRYRRILYPAVASGFGLMGGTALLWGMILMASASIGLAAAAVALLGKKLALPRWSPLAVVLNPGIWMSAILLTSDSFALALALLAVVAFVNRRDGWAIGALAAAALTKEPYLAFALGLAGYSWWRGQKGRSLRLLAGVAAPLGMWWAYVAAAIGNPLESVGAVAPPLTGLLAAIQFWPRLDPGEVFYLMTALGGAALAVWVILRAPRLWAWLVGPWLLIALVSSHLVWSLGNNAIRALAPLLTLGIIGTLARHNDAPSPAPRRSEFVSP